MDINHDGLTYRIERLSLGAMQARAFPIGFNENPGTFILVFDEDANVIEVLR